MKKILLLVGGFFFLILVAILSVPLFVDVDQYRPLIVEQANKKINGKLELGKLKLSLWGAININAESIKVSVNGYPGQMVDATQFHLEIPFLSVLTGRPQVIAVLDNPKITVLKDERGKMNMMELMNLPGAQAMIEEIPSDTISSLSAAAEKNKKTNADSKADSQPATVSNASVPSPATAPAAPVAAPSPAPTASTQVSDGKIPAILVGASLGVRIKEGNLRYTDKLTKSEYVVDGLDLDARNLGLGSTMNIKVKAPVKGATPTMNFEGPVEALAEITPVLAGEKVRSAKGMIDLDASKLAITVKGDLFKKTASMPMLVKARFDGDEKELLIKTLDVQFHEFKLHGKGRVTVEPMTAKVEVTSDPLRLEKVEDFVPMLAAYQLKGLLSLNANMEAEPNAMRVNGDLKLSDGSVFPKQYLKEPMNIQAQIGFSETNLNITRVGLSAPDSELQLQGTVRNFMAPQFSLSLVGKSFNVDKTLVLPAAKKTAWIQFISEAFAEGKTSLNPMMSMAANPVMAKATGLFNAQINRITAYEANFEQVIVKSQLQNMVYKIQEASLRTFGGSVKSTGEFDLKSPGLNYRSQGSVNGISGKDAFSTYFPKYKNTLEGKVDANWNISGAAFPETVRMKSLKGTAKLVATDGALKSMDFQGSINSAMAKVPFLKNSKPIQIDDGFKSMMAELKFSDGNIQAEPIEVQPRNKGFVVKGKSHIQESLEQESFFDVFDPQGQLPKELANPGKPAIALRLYGPLTSPKTDYDYTVKKLASSAGKNVGKSLLEKALSGAGGGGDGNSLGDQLKKKFKLFK